VCSKEAYRSDTFACVIDERMSRGGVGAGVREKSQMGLNVLQPLGKLPNKCQVALGTAPCVFCFTGNVAVLDRVFALQVSLLVQGFDAGYRHHLTLVYALYLFTAFKIAGGNVVADLPRYHVQDT
jgi:hypothetical protein